MADNNLEMGRRLCLRIDDIGASSKKFEVYSQRFLGLGNWLFLKYLPGIRAWGPYREMTASDWDATFDLLWQFKARLTVAVTGAWVEWDGSLIPFPAKFPGEAAKLREGVQSGLIEIANHGLTHCVLQDFRFRPKAFSSNRKEHREFWDWIPASIHEEHLMRSQDILEGCFGSRPTTLVPPGNVFSEATLHAAVKTGIRKVNCNNADRAFPGLEIVNNKDVLAFHDRELVLWGTPWLKKRLESISNDTRFVFARDL
jgi:peptidoglycan/xylan/chitin deacetylase (PgdA/CDA1 family)